MDLSQQPQVKKVYRPPHKRLDESNPRQAPISNANISHKNEENHNKYDFGNSNYHSKHNNIRSTVNGNSNINKYNTNDNNDHNDNNDNLNNNNDENEQYLSNDVENLNIQNDNNNNEYDENYDDHDNNHNDNNDRNDTSNNLSFNRNYGNRFNNYNSRNNNNNMYRSVDDNNANNRYHYSNTNKYDNYSRNNNTYNNYNNNRFNSYNNNSRFQQYHQQRSYDNEEEDLESELFKDENHEMVQGINFAQYDRIPVEVSGLHVPPAINSFEESSLNELLLNNVKRSKYSKPTPIQKYAIPCVLEGRDLMACAQTGSGKTAAFLLPIIHHLFSMQLPQARRNNFRYCAPIAVVLAPTRELAIQIHVQARKFLFESQYRSVVVYGGAEPRKQTSTLYQGCEILVATPGRLNDFLERQIITLECVKFCVLDEADRMLDMGFMPQIQGIIHEMPEKQHRNTLMFSATFPLEIQRLAQEFLNNYVFIAIGRVGSTTSFIKQKLRYVTEGEKLDKLIELLSSCEGLKLIFVEKKRDAAMVEKELIRAGFDAISIHGDRTQKEREYALQVFRTARVPILVATDVAARGLDIPNVMWVFNFDLPNNIDSYVHRIGRTGRCGNEGNAVAFVNETNKPIFKDLLKLLKETKQEIPQWFANLVYSSSHSRDSQHGSYSNKKYGQYGFGSRDYRTQKQFGNNNTNNGNGNSNSNEFFKRNIYINNNDGTNNNDNNNDNNDSNNAISHRREFVHNSKTENNTQQAQDWQNDSW